MRPRDARVKVCVCESDTRFPLFYALKPHHHHHHSQPSCPSNRGRHHTRSEFREGHTPNVYKRPEAVAAAAAVLAVAVLAMAVLVVVASRGPRPR